MTDLVETQTFSYIGDPAVDHVSGYTNNYLDERNNLFPRNFGGEYRRVEENPVPPDFVYCTFRDIAGTPVMRAFFSKCNLDHLQDQLINQVYEKSCGNFRISRQSDDELLIIMRSMYLQYTRNLPTDIAGQVRELNKQVLLYAVPNILSRIQGYIGYVRDQQTPNKFLSNSIYISPASKILAGDFSSLII